MWYKVVEGMWFDFFDFIDKVKLFGVGVVFINVVRFFVLFCLVVVFVFVLVVVKFVVDNDDD